MAEKRLFADVGFLDHTRYERARMRDTRMVAGVAIAGLGRRSITGMCLFTSVAIALSGCRSLLGIETPEDPPPFDRCTANRSDPQHRSVVNLGDGDRTWAGARAACRRYGWDLAVFHDESELGTAPVEGWPYWFGAFEADDGAWRTVDDCPGITVPSGLDPAPRCGAVVDALAPLATSCTDDSIATALCEVPPTTASCAAQVGVHSYTALEAHTYSVARDICERAGRHLVVVDDSTELLAIADLVRDGTITGRFWFGAILTDDVWKTVTGCPAIFSWANGAPDLTDQVQPACLAGELVEGELVGMAITPCTEGRLTVCEK